MTKKTKTTEGLWELPRTKTDNDWSWLTGNLLKERAEFLRANPIKTGDLLRGFYETWSDWAKRKLTNRKSIVIITSGPWTFDEQGNRTPYTGDYPGVLSATNYGGTHYTMKDIVWWEALDLTTSSRFELRVEDIIGKSDFHKIDNKLWKEKNAAQTKAEVDDWCARSVEVMEIINKLATELRASGTPEREIAKAVEDRQFSEWMVRDWMKKS